MMMLGPLAFAAPWVLAAGLGLPALWFLLRAIPPRPREVVFPGTTLLAGLADSAPIARRTPWWLLALRIAALAAAILALAGPIWRPPPATGGAGPLLIVIDAGWAAAPGWQDAQGRARTALDQARGAGRPVALWLADGQGGRGPSPVFVTADDGAAALRAAVPQPWATRYPTDPAAFLAEAPARFDTLWLADGIDHPGRAPLLAALTRRGEVTVVPPRRIVRSLALAPGPQPRLTLSASAPGDLPAVLAMGPDPRGIVRELARLSPGEPGALAGGGITAEVSIDLPPELRNRITRFAVEGEASAGAVVLADDRVRRRKVALVGDLRATEGQSLLSPLHYVRQALEPSADLVEGGIAEVLPAAPDVVVMVDAGPGAQAGPLSEWVEDGGLLIRFAGPRMALSDTLTDDPLLPVRLRPGGRDAGGALSWGEPRRVAPFAAGGMFAGLSIPPDVTVRAQLLPQPDPDLPSRTLAQLTDGTPLVTRAALGQGQIVLVHTSANAEWGNLALSGLFVEMLERLVQSARRQLADVAAPPDDAPHWTPETVLDGFGQPQDPGGLAPVAAADFAVGPKPGAPAGVYAAGERRASLNAGQPLVAAGWPGATVETAGTLPGTPLGGWLLGLAMALLATDALASALIAGTRRGRPAAGRGVPG